MKKRIPTLVLFGVVFLVFSILLGWKSFSKNKNNPDRDYDGVLNIKDSCPDQYAKTANGCPVETKSQLGTDKDKDGRYAEFQKDTALFDQNDNNPCIPNPTCDYCDYDGDGLTYPEERAKNTEPTLKDTDGDGVNDKLDRCPRDYGIAENDGCKLVIDVNLTKNKSILRWNEKVNQYAEQIFLYVTTTEGLKIFTLNKSSSKCDLKEFKLDIRITKQFEFKATMNKGKGITLINTIATPQ